MNVYPMFVFYFKVGFDFIFKVKSKYKTRLILLQFIRTTPLMASVFGKLTKYKLL